MSKEYALKRLSEAKDLEIMLLGLLDGFDDHIRADVNRSFARIADTIVEIEYSLEPALDMISAAITYLKRAIAGIDEDKKKIAEDCLLILGEQRMAIFEAAKKGWNK